MPTSTNSNAAVPGNNPSSGNNASSGGSNPQPMTKSDAARIQSSQVSSCCVFSWPELTTCFNKQAQGGKDMSAGGFAARAQAAGDRNANSGGK